MSCINLQPCVDWAMESIKECREEKGDCLKWEKVWGCKEPVDCFASWENAAKCALGILCFLAGWIYTGFCELYETLHICEWIPTLVKVACEFSEAVINGACDLGQWLGKLASAV